MNINLAENLFYSTFNFVELDSLSISFAKERFLEYQTAGVIKKDCSFNDNIWYTTNEYANVGLYFNFNRFAYQKYEFIFNLPFDAFIDFAKTYCISIFGKNVLISIEDTLLDIKHLIETDYNDICGEMANIKLYSANRLSDFLSLLITDENFENLNHLIQSLDAYIDIHSNKGSNQRELADFDSYLDFGEILENYWKSDISKDDRIFYYPLYIWWILTTIIPLRPREFLLLERNCLFHDPQGRYNLKLRRNQLKGGKNGNLSHKIADAYLTVPQPIPNHIGILIETYIKETEKYEDTELNTLFVTDPHYKKWGQKKHSDSRFLTYVNMNTILKYFYKEIIQDKYGYTVYYNHEAINHDNREIQYIHLGDARHIAFFNLIEEGATPVTAMLLGGHTNIEMASHYYSNVVSFIECKTYRQYRKMISNHTQYKLSHMKKLPPVGIPATLSDGSLCYSEHYKNCSEKDCLQAIGPNGKIGYCEECTYHRRNGLSYFSGDDIYKHHIEQDCKLLLLAVQSVMEEKGNTENIQEALLRLNSSNYAYQSYLAQKFMLEKEEN